MWCWAASGQMIMAYLGHDVNQCTQANNAFGQTRCPCNQCGASPEANPTPACISGGWPEFEKYGFESKQTSEEPLAWNALTRQLSDASNCKRRPFAFSWHWPGGGGHMMVAKGYSTVAGVNHVEILDPWSPCQGDERIITYDEFDAVPGNHTHWNDYYDIAYTGT